MSAEAFRDSSCQSTRHSVQENGQYGAGKEAIFFHFLWLVFYQRNTCDMRLYVKGSVCYRYSADNGALISVCSANANHCREYLHESYS